jgi:hypothetical protein
VIVNSKLAIRHGITRPRPGIVRRVFKTWARVKVEGLVYPQDFPMSDLKLVRGHAKSHTPDVH